MFNFIGGLACFATLSVISRGECVSSTVAGLNKATFHRTCTYDSDCNFRHPSLNGIVFLTCNNGQCQCSNPREPMMDVANYPVRIDQGKCFVSYNAPCGHSDGLKLFCEAGKSCIQNRCRSETMSNPIGYSCEENIDCQTGLKCVAREDSFPPSSYCQ